MSIIGIFGGIIEEWMVSLTAFHNRNKGFYLSDRTIFQMSDSGCMHNNYTNDSLKLMLYPGHMFSYCAASLIYIPLLMIA